MIRIKNVVEEIKVEKQEVTACCHHMQNHLDEKHWGKDGHGSRYIWYGQLPRLQTRVVAGHIHHPRNPGKGFMMLLGESAGQIHYCPWCGSKLELVEE